MECAADTWVHSLGQRFRQRADQYGATLVYGDTENSAAHAGPRNLGDVLWRAGHED